MFGQYGIQIGPLSIHYYALILMAGILVAAWLTAWRAKRAGHDPQYVWDGLIYVIIPAVVGARLYHILTPSPSAVALDGVTPLTTAYYLAHPLEMLAIWNGGLGIYGAVVGGVFGAVYYARRQHLNLLRWLDFVAPAVLVGQAIGRWGNFVNNELYGAPSTLPWAIYIPPERRVPGYQGFSTFHPLFLYESIMSLIACGILLLVERRARNWLRPGDLALIYLILYPIERFLLDFVRLDSNGFGPLTTAQMVSLLTCLGAALVLAIRHRSSAVTASKAAT
ncbi:MAG TPA: prolipoprotein diacylglyceryl transferase [Aggregatilineales bacterium]|nr:prolipoprotein diacylglyceryl transferase [Aggregatilineales bacterium]